MREGERPGWQNRTEAEIRTFYWSHEMTKIINVEHKSPLRTQLYHRLHTRGREGRVLVKIYFVMIGLPSKDSSWVSQGYCLHPIYKN